MSDLEKLFDGFKQRLPREVDFFGPDEVERRKGPPSITWEPFTAAHSAPRRLGGGRNGVEGSLWTRELTIHVKLWGETHAQTQQLLETFVNAVHADLTQGGYQLAGEAWSRSGPGVSKGFEVVLSLVLLIPLQRTPAARRPLTEIDATFTLNTEV